MTTDTPQLVEALTRREEEVLDRLRRGLTNRQIAGELGISADGVKFHVSSILGKLGVRSRYEAAVWPKPARWWAGALAPVALWWRRTKPAIGPNFSTATAWLAGGVLFATLAALALAAFLLARTNDDGSIDVLQIEPDVALAQAVEQTRNADSYRMTVDLAGETQDTGRRQYFEMAFQQPDRYHAIARNVLVMTSTLCGGIGVPIEPGETPPPVPTFREDECVESTPEVEDHGIVEVVAAGGDGLVRACSGVGQACDDWSRGSAAGWEPRVLGVDPWQGPAWPFVLVENLALVEYRGVEVVDGGELQHFRGFGDAFKTAFTIFQSAYREAAELDVPTCESEDCSDATAATPMADDTEVPSQVTGIDVFVDPATRQIRRIDVTAFPWVPFTHALLVTVEYSDFGNVSVELPE